MKCSLTMNEQLTFTITKNGTSEFTDWILQKKSLFECVHVKIDSVFVDISFSTATLRVISKKYFLHFRTLPYSSTLVSVLHLQCDGDKVQLYRLHFNCFAGVALILTASSEVAASVQNSRPRHVHPWWISVINRYYRRVRSVTGAFRTNTGAMIEGLRVVIGKCWTFLTSPSKVIDSDADQDEKYGQETLRVFRLMVASDGAG